MSDADAIRVLRSHREGVLICDGAVLPLRFVIDNRDGRIVFPCSALPFESDECVLFVPEESDDALQLLLLPRPADPDIGEGCDRWKAYHGTPEFPRWASCAIESGRLGDEVVEGATLMNANPLRAAEPSLCKHLNADPARLTRLCARISGVEVPSPLCVGVDPAGLDVRARFGIVRVPFRSPVHSAEEARAETEALLAEPAP